jgi:hypothetical protein
MMGQASEIETTTDFVSTSKESDDVKGVGEQDEGLENGSAGGPKPERW